MAIGQRNEPSREDVHVLQNKLTILYSLHDYLTCDVKTQYGRISGKVKQKSEAERKPKPKLRYGHPVYNGMFIVVKICPRLISSEYKAKFQPCLGKGALRKSTYFPSKIKAVTVNYKTHNKNKRKSKI